ncbi:cobyric acid synthase [Kineothrix sp. MSJ-39]|uniref:cobyric acid synthase n=1 Tax=Kineothrix sp. MSJ-39 TaxID=2841533 RepID=UPI001C11919F|nr:cobyric acid synthase [Kineothrix sp. MSJ-39]MBU5430166.1 cobyric acid synthase [Kineothrix sp. MSJ-39]
MSKVIMVQGTMSSAGKSLVVAGLCRIFKQDGYRVAPFKSQNMALNSFITKDGAEMGRAQVMQAEAAGIEPDVCMNPILLKPTNDSGSQVIVNGQVLGNMAAKDYFTYKPKLLPAIREAFRKLSEKADIIVIEGAGSPAEINLRENDIVNMGMAELVDAPVLLVGDIDRGGVFAQLLGTLMLLTDEERERVKGLIINKFRGDKTILDPGIIMLEERGQIPVCGVLPYMKLSLDDEDSLTTRFTQKGNGVVTIAVVRLPRISNISDFTVFEQIDDVNLIYVNQPKELEQADMVILPGSKNTIGDLKWLRQSGMEAAIKRFAIDNPVFGICGGYQMLGEQIDDPEQTEEGGSIRGMELLPIRTVLKLQKQTRQVTGTFDKVAGIFSCLSGQSIRGYEIHMGETSYCENIDVKITDMQEEINRASGLLHLATDMHTDRSGYAPVYTDGCMAGNVYGSYVHGIFDAGDLAYCIAETLAERKGRSLHAGMTDYAAFKEQQYDKLAETMREYLDMDAVYGMLREAKV